MKAIIFDMDGVIVDSEPLHFKLEEDLLEELGGHLSNDEHEKFVGTTDFHMWSIFKKQFNLRPSVDEMVDMKRKRFVDNIDKIKLIPNFIDFIDLVYSEGYKLALASSNNKKSIAEVVRIFNLEKYFEYIISGEEVEKGKPDPEIFLKAANKLNVDPEDCLVIEDARNGVIAAKSANMKCIGLKSKGSGKQDLSQADLVIEDFKELDIEVVKSLFE